MAEVTYRIDLWRFGNYPIKAFEVVSQTPKTVVIRVYYKSESSEGFCDSRYSLRSKDYAFFDTQEKAEHATENLVVNRMRESIARTDELRERLQEVCKHKAITGPSDGRCIRCNFKVPNPEEYCDGG